MWVALARAGDAVCSAVRARTCVYGFTLHIRLICKVKLFTSVRLYDYILPVCVKLYKETHQNNRAAVARWLTLKIAARCTLPGRDL